MADVFISYARGDKARVAPLVAAIEGKGWTVWWDPEIDAGQQFDDQIEAELLAAAAVVVVWTATSVGSRWVRGEAREAADRNILVPVRFDVARLPMDVRAIHTIDLDQWGEDPASAAFQDLARALESMITRQRKATAGTQPAAGAATPAAPAQPRVSICVLPFSNMSGDLEQEYFSDGISEDIITDLSKVSALAVVSRNTAFTFKGKNVDLPQVARQLKVNYVLEGSVRRAGGRVRITAQLIEASSDNHLWAERYDRDLVDIFALQDEISEAIVKALKLKLLPEEKKAIEQRGTTNLDAYNLYLMARHHYTSGMLSDTRKNDTVIRLCRGVIELDPTYAQAWALMAAAQRYRLGMTGEGDNGDAAATRALELDTNLAEAHAAKAGVLASSGDYEAAREEITTALRLDPESVDVLRGWPAQLHATPVPGGHCALGKGVRVGRDGLRGWRVADHVLHDARRQGERDARRAAHTGPGREDHCARWRQRFRHGLDFQLPASPRRRRSREGMGQACGADRPGQHDHALQPGVRPDGESR
jgi:adenylate cyclase